MTDPDALPPDAVPPEAIPLFACTACGTMWTLSRPACPACGSRAVESREAEGRGEVWSVTEIHRAAPPAFAPLMPYALALVTLVEGPKLLGHAAPGLQVGDAVRGGIETLATAEGPRRLPVFRRA